MSNRSSRSNTTAGGRNSSAVVASGKKRSSKDEEEDEEEALVVFSPEKAESAAVVLRRDVRGITSGSLAPDAKVDEIVASMARAKDSHALEKNEFEKNFNASFMCAICLQGNFTVDMFQNLICRPDPQKSVLVFDRDFDPNVQLLEAAANEVKRRLEYAGVK